MNNMISVFIKPDIAMFLSLSAENIVQRLF